MTIRKTIVCLANSRKNSHRCIAGMEFPSSDSYRWIRPIGHRSGHGVSEQELILQNSLQPQPLDWIEIGLLNWSPEGHQQENHYLDASIPWKWVGRCTWDQVVEFPMSSGPLWINGFQTNNGINNYVPEGLAASLTSSLVLVRSQPTISVSSPYDPSKPLDVIANFHHAGQDYRLKVTDSIAEDKFRAKGIGLHALGDSILTISLGEAWQNQVYKLVAAIIEKSPT